MIRMEFWGMFYYKNNKEPPPNSTGKYLRPYITLNPKPKTTSPQSQPEALNRREPAALDNPNTRSPQHEPLPRKVHVLLLATSQSTFK